jgi:hypothetical protein
MHAGQINHRKNGRSPEVVSLRKVCPQQLLPAALGVAAALQLLQLQLCGSWKYKLHSAMQSHPSLPLHG